MAVPTRRPLPPPPPRGPVVDAAGNMGPAWLLLMNRLQQNAGLIDRWLFAVEDLASMPTTLGPEDVGVLVSVPVFNHVVRWNGAGWDFAPGDPGNGFVATFLFGPTQAGWVPCDGSTVQVLVVGGGATLLTFPVVLPTVANQWFRL